MMARAIETKTGGTAIAQIMIEKVETNVDMEDNIFKMPKKEGGEKEKWSFNHARLLAQASLHRAGMSRIFTDEFRAHPCNPWLALCL